MRELNLAVFKFIDAGFFNDVVIYLSIYVVLRNLVEKKRYIKSKTEKKPGFYTTTTIGCWLAGWL
jgi:hypothetical protein